MEWSGVEWSGVEWSGVEWSGVEWSGVEWSGVEWSGVEWSGMPLAAEVFYIIGGGANSQKHRVTGAWHSDLPPKFQTVK